MASTNLELGVPPFELQERLTTGELISIPKPSSPVKSKILDQFYVLVDKDKTVIPGFAHCVDCKHVLRYNS